MIQIKQLVEKLINCALTWDVPQTQSIQMLMFSTHPHLTNHSTNHTPYPQPTAVSGWSPPADTRRPAELLDCRHNPPAEMPVHGGGGGVRGWGGGRRGTTFGEVNRIGFAYVCARHMFMDVQSFPLLDHRSIAVLRSPSLKEEN